MDSYILGIDIGTGSIKAVAIDPQGNVISALQSFYETIQPQPGYSEQDPEIIFSHFIQIINQSVNKIGTAPSGISLSSAMHSLVLTDKKGNAVYDPEPIARWKKRKVTVEKRIKK